MSDQKLRSEAIMREKNAHITQLSDGLCTLRGELAVAEAKIVALTERLNKLTEDQPALALSGHANGHAEASA